MAGEQRRRGSVDRRLLEFCRAWGRSRLAAQYYLAGGTALALQVGHRRSEDLGWFRRSSEGRLPARAIASELERLFGPQGVEPVRRQLDQASWAVKGVRVTFLAYPFPLLYDLVPGARVDGTLGEVWLASPKDVDAALELVHEPLALEDVEAYLRARVSEFVRHEAGGGTGP